MSNSAVTSLMPGLLMVRPGRELVGRFAGDGGERRLRR
jgi:hypothetical protein